MDKLRALYDRLSSDGLYTKTFEEFEQQFSDPNSQRRLYDRLSSDGLYTKTSEEFQQQFFSASQPDISQEIKDEFAEDPIREAVKKKDVTESVSEDGLSESQRKSKEIFEQIGGPSWRVSEEEMPLTEQSIAQMESPVDEAPSRRDIGTTQAVDFTGDRFDFQAEKEIEARKTEDPTEEEKDRRIVEEMFAVAKRDSPETEEAVRDEIITGQELEAYKRKKEKFEKDIDDVVKQGKRETIFQYNIIAAEQGLEPISEAEYVILFEDDEKSAEDLDKEIFDEISNQLEEIGLTQEEVDAIDEKNRQLVANGQEPVDYDFYITQKKNNLFNQYIRSQGVLPSQRKEAVTQSIIDADARILAPSSYGDIFDTTIDLTQGLDDKTRSERAEEIYKNKLKRNFIITNIPSEKFLQNANTLLTKETYDEVVKEANENFYNNYGEQEWDVYTKISGNTDPTLMGTEYENDNQDNSLVNQAVVIDDEDATVENLQRLFPNSSFRFEATGIKDDYITISTVSPDGEVVKALEIYLGEDNDPARRVREFMQGALLTKKDKAFLNKDYNYEEDPLWRLEMYDYMLSNPQKFGERDSPAMYRTKRAVETVDFKEIGDYLDTYKEDIPDETMELMRAKMSYAESYYSGELAQKGTLTTALTSGLLTGLSAPSRFVSNQIANVADAFGAEGAKEAKDGVISAIESAQEQISGTTTESIAERDLLGTLINTMASSGTAMVLGMGNPYATFGSFLMQSSPATERLLKDEDIPEYQKGLISILMGSVEGALETYGAQTLLTPSSKGVFKRLIIDSIKDLPSDAPQELIERAIKNSIRLKLKSGALQVAEGMAVEAATEAQQAQLEDLNKRLFNAIYEKEIFQVPDWTTEEGRKQWAEQIIESAKIGALSGGGFAVSIHGTKSLAKGFQDKADNNRFNKTYNEVMNNSAFNEAKRNFQKIQERGIITEQELELLNNQLDESREIMQSIPSALSTNRKRQAYNLLTEKRAIERSMQNKSPELVASQKDRIKSIDAQLKIVGNEEVAETPDVVEEFVKDKPSRMEKVTRYQEIENITKPKEAEVVAEEELSRQTRKEAPVTEQKITQEQVEELWKNESQDSRIELEGIAEEQLKKEDSDRRAMLRSMGQRIEKKPITDEQIKTRAKELLAKKSSETISKKQDKAPLTEESGRDRRETTVKEEQPTVPRKALETQPITKITTELVAKEKKGELTQEETDGILLGIMEKMETENAKRKTPLSPEQAQKKLGKMQQRVFEANKDRYLELSGVMPAAQEQVVEQVKEKPRFEDSKVPVGRKTFTITDPVEGTTTTHRYKVYLDGSIGQFETLKNGKFEDASFGKRTYEQIKKTFEKEGDVVEITKEEDYKSVMNPKMFDKLTTNQQQRVDSERAKTAPVKKEAPKRKRRRKKVAPAVKEELKVSEEVTTPAAQEQVVEQVKEKPRFKDSQVSVSRKTFTTTQLDNGSIITYTITEYLDGRVVFDKIVDGKPTPFDGFKFKSYEDLKEVFEKDGDFKVEIIKEEDYKAIMNPKMFDRLTTDQQQRVDSERAKTAPVKKEAPKRKRRRKKVAPAVKEELKVSEEVTTPIAKPKVVVSGTADGYQVVSSSNTTQAENESVKDARGDKTFDKDGFRITKLKDGSSQVSYKSKVKVSDKGNRPGYAMATVTIPKGSPINKQQIQESFDNKLSEIIESNRKKKLGSKFSDLTAKQSQQLTDAVVNALSQEQVVEKAPVKKAPKKTTKKKAPVKEEPQVSEEVQKEIDRAEGTRDSIVGPLKTKLDRTRGFEQKEEIRDEIRQTEKRYNNIITELKEGKRTQFQVKETQETKTDTSRYQQFVSVLKRSFPSVEVVTTQAEFDALLKETGAIELTTKDQSVYGAVYQGKLYLNPSLANYNTPIHEFGHVWMNVAKETNPELYEKGISLVKGSKYEQQVRNNPAYKDSTEQEILEEALATAIGDKGESFVKESQKKNFKDWLNTLYKFVRKLTGISKYTAKQLEDITLDEFTQAVAVDLLSGKQLFEGAEITDMGDALQLMAEKGVDLDAAMNESINQMIDKGFKAAEIKGVLQQMGYKARAINDALVVKIDADMKLPNEFANIDGGVREGETMFRSVMQKLKEFAAPKLVKRSIKEQYKEAKKDGYEGTIKEYTEEQNNKKVEVLKQANPLLTLLTNEEILERYPNIQNEIVEKQQKSRAEIRAKAIELLEAEAAFKSQDALMQKELVVSMDRTMKTRSNKEVQKRISAIKQTLKGVREGVKDLQAAKKRIKNFINEELLPSGVSVREANKLVRIVEKATKETYESSVAEVMKVVEAQTSKKKKETIDKMLKLAQQKSKVTNKRARTDTDARRFFEQAVVVLKALDSKDTKSLEDIQSKLIENEEKIYEILDALNDGLEVNDTDRNLSALAQAFDILGSLNNQDLSQHEDALNLMKSELESGMESLRTRRAARKAVYDKLREEANKNIKEGYEFLFDENGQPLETAELDNLSDELKQEMWNNITSIPKLLSAVNKFTKLQAQKYGKFSMFFDSVKNLGTLLRGLDRKGKFFEKNVFDKLNNMEEEYLQGYFNTMDMLESELDAIGIKGGIDGLNKIINKEFVIAKTIDLKDIKLSLKKSARPVVKLTRGEAMRIYALSKNATQMSRLKDQGFTPAKMQQIEEFIGPQLVEATDVIVDFLSSSYYESINKVYEDVNDISLPYIENYFPTKTSPSKGSTAAEFDRLSKEIKSGNFAGVFSAQQASALKERSSKDAIDIRYKDFSSVLEDHLRTMERFKAYAMGTKEINIIVNHTTSVKTLLAATRLNKTIENSIMAAINPDAVQQLFESSKGGKAFTFFQRQFTGITLALKPIQVLKQMSSFINAWEDYSLRGQEKRIPVVDTVLDALGFSYDIAVTFILLPKVWGKYSTYNKAMYSASFKDRVRQSFKTADLLGLEQGVGARRRSKKTRLGRALRKAKVVSNSPTLVGDIAGVMGYMAAYRANMRNGMSQKEAIEKFNKYNETQQTRRGTDKIGLQANGNMYTRVFTMFGSSLFLQLNKVMQSVTKLRRGSIDSFKSAVKGDWKGTKENFPKEKDLRALYVNLAVANVLFAMMSNIFKYNPFMDDDDEELTEEEMERIKKAQNALKRGKEVSDEDMKLMERHQFKLDKEEVLKAYENAKYGLNQLFNLPLVGPSLQQNWDYYYWNNPNAFSTDKKSRAVNPLEQTFSRNFWDRTLNDVSDSESVLKTIINFALGVDVNRPLAMIEALQSYWGDDEMYREGYEELNDKGERKFKGTFEEYKAKQMEENMYELLGISYSYRPGSGKDWTKKKMTIAIDPKAEGEEEEKSSNKRKRRRKRKRR